MSGNISQVDWELPEARSYYVAASFWRVSLYLVIAGLVFGPLFVAVEDFVQRPDPINPWVVLGASLLFSLFFAQFLFIYLKVDEHGISRRIFWRWDLWPWESFADGSVEEAGCYCYRLRSKPIWRQRLALVIDDAESVNNLILRVWKRPEPEPIPDAVSVQMQGFLDAPRVDIRPEGLTVAKKKETRQYAWTDVIHVTIWRSARYRRDFREIEIELPSTKLTFRTGDGKNWQGVAAETVAGILRQYVPERRLRDFTLQGTPISVEEVDARHALRLPKIEASEKQLPYLIWLVWLIKGAAVVFVGAGLGAMVGFYVLLFYGMAYLMRRENRRVTTQYEAERAALLDAAGLTDEDDIPPSVDDTESPAESQAA